MTAARDLRYGQVLHYLWGGDDAVHSSAMFIMPTKDHRLMLMPLADTHLTLPVLVPIVSKMAGGYEPCTPSCFHHPDHSLPYYPPKEIK